MTTPLGDLVRLLASTGCPPDKIAEAVELADRHARELLGLVAGDPAATKRRAWDAARKRNQRAAAVKPSSVSTGQTQDSLLLTSPPLSKDSQHKERKKEVVTRAKGEPLPVGWTPTPADREYARKRGYADVQMDEITERMQLWATANAHSAKAHKADWSATWKTFLRNQRPALRECGASQLELPVLQTVGGTHARGDGRQPWQKRRDDYFDALGEFGAAIDEAKRALGRGG
jgi:hypothetical protein